MENLQKKKKALRLVGGSYISTRATREDPGRTSSTRPGIRLLLVNLLNGRSYGFRDVTCSFCTWQKVPATRVRGTAASLMGRGRRYCIRAKYAWYAHHVTAIKTCRKNAISSITYEYFDVCRNAKRSSGRTTETSKFYEKKKKNIPYTISLCEFILRRRLSVVFPLIENVVARNGCRRLFRARVTLAALAAMQPGT